MTATAAGTTPTSGKIICNIDHLKREISLNIRTFLCSILKILLCIIYTNIAVFSVDGQGLWMDKNLKIPTGSMIKDEIF